MGAAGGAGGGCWRVGRVDREIGGQSMEAVMETLAELLAYAARRGYELIEMKTRTMQAAG